MDKPIEVYSSHKPISTIFSAHKKATLEIGKDSLKVIDKRHGQIVFSSKMRNLTYRKPSRLRPYVLLSTKDAQCFVQFEPMTKRIAWLLLMPVATVSVLALIYGIVFIVLGSVDPRLNGGIISFILFGLAAITVLSFGIRRYMNRNILTNEGKNLLSTLKALGTSTTRQVTDEGTRSHNKVKRIILMLITPFAVLPLAVIVGSALGIILSVSFAKITGHEDIENSAWEFVLLATMLVMIPCYFWGYKYLLKKADAAEKEYEIKPPNEAA